MSTAQRILKKLKNRRGETITEVLAAMLVIALGIVMLVSMEMAAQNLVRKSEAAFTANMAQKNGIEEGAGASDVATADSKVLLSRKDAARGLSLIGEVPDSGDTDAASSSGEDTYDLGLFAQNIDVQTITAPAEDGLTLRYVPKTAESGS